MDKDTKINEYAELHARGVEFFSENYWVDAAENARFRRGKHWSKAQEQGHEAQRRIPYSIPLVESKFATIESQQLQTPYDIIAIPRTSEDEINAAIKTALFKYISDVNDLKHLISEWFKDGIVKKYGVLKRFIDNIEGVRGEIRIEKVLYDYVIWDSNCKKFDISRYANWMQEYGYYTRDELKEMYPEKSKVIDGLPEKSNLTDNADKSNNRYTNWYRTDKGQDLIKIVTHYQRRFRKIYIITFNDGSQEESAENVHINHETLPLQEQQLIDAQNGARYPVSSSAKPQEYYTVCVFTKDANEELESYEVDSARFPFAVFFSNFDDGEIWSLMDLAKNPQKFIDRLISQIDASMGKMIKNSYEISWDMLSKEAQDNWHNISQDLISGGAVIPVRSMHGGGHAIRPIQSGNLPPVNIPRCKICK